MALSLATQYNDTSSPSSITFYPVDEKTTGIHLLAPVKAGPFSFVFGNVSPTIVLEVTGVAHDDGTTSHNAMHWIYNQTLTPLYVTASTVSAGFVRMTATIENINLDWLSGIQYWNVLRDGGSDTWVIHSTYLFNSPDIEMTFLYDQNFHPYLRNLNLPATKGFQLGSMLMQKPYAVDVVDEHMMGSLWGTFTIDKLPVDMHSDTLMGDYPIAVTPSGTIPRMDLVTFLPLK